MRPRRGQVEATRHDEQRAEPMRVRRVAGFSVHVFTASGGAVALLALYAAIERDFPRLFRLARPGAVHRRHRRHAGALRAVTETAATIDGAILDLVVDFLTYVLVPVVALWRSDLMPTSVAFWIGLVVVIASALYFADTRMKTPTIGSAAFPRCGTFSPLSLRAAAAVAGQRGADAGRDGGDVRAGRLRSSAAGASRLRRVTIARDDRLVRARRRRDLRGSATRRSG